MHLQILQNKFHAKMKQGLQIQNEGLFNNSYIFVSNYTTKNMQGWGTQILFQNLLSLLPFSFCTNVYTKSALELPLLPAGNRMLILEAECLLAQVEKIISMK